MADPYERPVGGVADPNGVRAEVGVDYDSVTIKLGHSMQLCRLTRDQAEEFAHLFAAACWEAGENRRCLREEVHEADGGDSHAGCDAVTAAEGSGVWECTETGPHARHVARSVIDGTVLHTWQDAPTQDQARAAALERLARDMLASYHQGSDGYRGRVGQMQIRRWQAVVDGEASDG